MMSSTTFDKFVLSFLVFGFVQCLVIISSVSAEPIVSGVRIFEHKDKTRFVLDISEAVKYDLQIYPTSKRVIIDLPIVRWNIPTNHRRKRGGLILRWRHIDLSHGHFRARIELDLNQFASIKKQFLMSPTGGKKYRLVVDLVSSRSGTKFSLPTKKPIFGPKPIIVLDPGHGGVDPGAKTRSGVYEKDIVLVVAKALKRRLENDGRFKVLLTREKDVYVKLRDRIEIARSRKADLFISLHADAIKKKKVRGMSVYTLGLKPSSKEAAELAKRENLSDIIHGIDDDMPSDVRGILIDLAQQHSMKESGVFANFLVKNLRPAGKLLPNPLRRAGFAVLKSPRIPSVLVELGFVSNPLDVRLLKSTKFHFKLGDAFKRAIDNYFERLRKFEGK